MTSGAPRTPEPVIAFNRLTREFDIIRALQGLEYARVSRAPATMWVASDALAFPAIAREFAFDGIRVLPGCDAAGTVDGDDVFDRALLAPDFLRTFSALLTDALGPPKGDVPEPGGLDPAARLSLGRYDHLGDALAVAAGLEAYCDANAIGEVHVTGAHVFRQVIDTFDFRHVRWEESHDAPVKDMEYVYRLCSWTAPWLARFGRALHDMFGGALPASPRAPALRRTSAIASCDVVYCQFDSRASGGNWSEWGTRVLAAVCPGRPVTVLGGPDTTKYLGDAVPYSLGDISFLCQRLLECEAFIGCDSGIGHLAGVLGVRGYIVNFTDFEPVAHFFGDYPSLTIVDRRTLGL